MSKLWKWIDDKRISKNTKVGVFLLLNSLLYGLLGLCVWLVVSRFMSVTWGWAVCLIGYPGFFVGYIGGLIFLCRQ